MKLNRRDLRRLIESVINEETMGDIYAKAFNELGSFMMKAGMSKKPKDNHYEAFKNHRENLIKMKEDSNSPKKLKDILKDFNKDLSIAYYFGRKNKPDEMIKEKFGMTGTEAKSKIEQIKKDLELASKK